MRSARWFVRCMLAGVAVLGCLSMGWTQGAAPTEPVTPKIVKTPLPPPVELPPPPTLPADLPQRPITASEAAALALSHHPVIVQAVAGTAAAQGRTQQAQAALKPSVAVSAALNAKTGAGSSQIPRSAVAVSLNQLIYDLNHQRDLVRQARAQEAVAGAALTRVQLDLVLQVKQVFYQYLQSTRIVGVNEANVSNQHQHVALAQARLQSGLGLPYDVVRAEAALADGIYGLNSARNTASQSRVLLAQLMGIDPRTPVTPAESEETPTGADDVSALVDRALAQRPEMKQTLASVAASQYAVSAARSTNAPVVAGTLGVQRRGDDFPPNNNALFLGVGVQWDPFDGGFTAGKVKEAQANRQSAQAQVDLTRLQVIADVSGAYLNVKTAEQRVVTADAQIANAGEALRLAEGRYRAGIGTFIDVLDAQTAVETANSNRVNAQSAVDQARAALAHALGTDLVAAK